VVAIDKDSQPYFMANDISGDKLTGLIWEGESFSVDATMTLEEAISNGLNITHFYGLSDITYTSIYSFAWNYITKLIYIRINLYRYIDATFQYFFNKRKLTTKRRMDLLRFMMDYQIDSEHKGIGIISLLSKIYSTRLFLHPSKDAQRDKLELYLDSLVNSGELRKVNNEYIVEGAAISTIEKYEEEERRHTEAVKLQRKMFWLTVVAVIFAFIQTGVIKLPTILDLSDSPETQQSPNKSSNFKLKGDGGINK